VNDGKHFADFRFLPIVPRCSISECSGEQMDLAGGVAYRRRPARFFRGYNRQGSERRHISARAMDERFIA